jgi:ubiquinone/menaquinone biosynthesis C-methylase UbiE
MTGDLKAGDFTGLANDYSLNRPDYSKTVLKGLFGIQKKKISEIDFVDIGAGTGIWTRMVQSSGVKSTVAVEPNEDMRNAGKLDSDLTKIDWREGSAEDSGLENSSCDWISMASSFHWADFDAATREFHRILREGGLFTAVWNPRLIEVNPLLVEIEDYLNTFKTDIKRVSSGRSGITQILTDKLWASPYFTDVIYMEGRHVISMPVQRYMGAWRSVNDLRVQLGNENFNCFLDFVENRISGLDHIDATYLTRAWSAIKN